MASKDSETTHNLGQDELLALLRDASLRPESIREEIECAGASGCSAQAISEARALLERCASAAASTDAKAIAEGLAALPELLGSAVLRAAAEAGRQEILVEVAQGPKKGLSKEAKRELQRLKQKGVKVQEVAAQGAPVVRPIEEEIAAAACFISSVDGQGERAVWYARAARTGVDLAQIVTSDVRGILSAEAMGLSRRTYRELLKRLPRGGLVSVAEVPAAFARLLVAEAEDIGNRGGHPTPNGYAQALRILGPAPQQPVPHPALELTYGEQSELAHQLAGAALFSDPLLAPWIPEEGAFAALLQRTDEIKQGKLYVDEAQRQEALAAAAREAAVAYFDAARRARYARRLLDLALVLRSDGRLDAARTALAVSRALEAGAAEAMEPFCTALFTRALELDARREPPGPAMAAPGSLAP
jgi:hypothetical protein